MSRYIKLNTYNIKLNLILLYNIKLNLILLLHDWPQSAISNQSRFLI